MKSRTYFLLSALCMVCCVLCLFAAFGPRDDSDSVEKLENAGPSLENAEQSVDFKSLTERNADIYAWINIAGTEIDYPVVQSGNGGCSEIQGNGQEDFYMSHDSLGKSQSAGALFTEGEYNSTDFTDPVTVIYGHRMRSGAKFGRLQENFKTADELKKHQKISIYTPEGEIEYRVFAAVPYDREHIHEEYDLEDRKERDRFLHNIFMSDGVFDENIEVGQKDRIIVLSTCLKGNNKRRFIVLAKEVTGEAGRENGEERQIEG